MALPRFPRVPGRIALTGNTRFFFDRQFIRNSLNKAEWTALTRASLKVKDFARKSIKKFGRARPLLSVQKTYPDMTLDQISKLAGISREVGAEARDARGRFLPGSRRVTSREGKITESDRTSVLQRMREIRYPPASPPGSPPHTHTPHEGHQASYLGFRRNLWNFYDPSTRSAVVGPSAKGRNLPFLHEFGGTVNTQTMVWIPRMGRSMRRPIIREVGEYGGMPKPRKGWAPVGTAKTKTYPRRPFMRPALLKAIRTGAIARAFANTFGNDGARVSTAGASGSVSR